LKKESIHGTDEGQSADEKAAKFETFWSSLQPSFQSWSLAIFCPSCPQPGINLPPDWKDLPNWITRRTITVDGNFHADHIKMRRPDLDIALSNGQGYMVEDGRYMEYLSVVKEPRLVSGLMYLAFVSQPIHLTRGHLVGTIEPSTQQALTIDET
jgi:hypothetical protein